MLLKSLKVLGQTFVEVIQTRVDILSLDLREYRLRFISIMMLSAVAFLCLSLGAVVGTFWMIQSFHAEYRFAVMGILAAVFLSGGIILILVLAFKLFRDPNPLHGSRAELEKDKAAIGGYEMRMKS
jgi:uncharacterized membrane protein YqjE